MKAFQIITSALLVAAIGAGAVAVSPAPQDPPAIEGMPEFAAPQKEHEWLQKWVGEWTVESEMVAPGMPPMKASGTDSVRSIGGRWIVAELKSEVPGMGTMNAILTLGFNAATGKYQGTWIDSHTDQLWVYDGTMNSAGTTLTLEAEGPNMMDPTSTKPTKYRDVIEVKSADHRVLTSSAQDENGEWVHFMTAHYRRIK
jgi:hypothetical protein